MREASTINPVVADILPIRARHSIQFFLNPYVFYHLGQDNLSQKLQYPTLETPLTPNLTPDWTCAFPINSKPTGSRTPH